MKNVNIGIANLLISKKLKDSYFNNTPLDESKKLTTDFFDVIKSSPILQLEFKVFNNIENKTIENDLIATRYIDNNIKLFEVYTIAEIDAERAKLNEFIEDRTIVAGLEKANLYNAIDTLITESLNDYDKVDVDAIHESFNLVLNYIKTPKKQTITETIESVTVNEDVIEIATEKFNEKYKALNENDKNLIKRLMMSTHKEKETILEEYKSECISILENANTGDINEHNTKIVNAINSIKELKYNDKTIDNDIVNLHEFKSEII